MYICKSIPAKVIKCFSIRKSEAIEIILEVIISIKKAVNQYRLLYYLIFNCYYFAFDVKS